MQASSILWVFFFLLKFKNHLNDKNTKINLWSLLNTKFLIYCPFLYFIFMYVAIIWEEDTGWHFQSQSINNRICTVRIMYKQGTGVTQTAVIIEGFF
jgi:hypothetical protein